jgi:hypothetical protein
MRHKITVLALVGYLFLIAGCNKEKTANPVEGNYFYKFDEVAHYTIAEEKVKTIYNRDNKTEKDSITRKLYYRWSDKRLDAEVDKLNKSYYTSERLDTILYPKLREVFKERSPTGDGSETACEPEFRDIFVFKNEGEIIGMSKICYTCGKFDFIGTKANTNNFGNNGEFVTLSSLLSKNEK